MWCPECNISGGCYCHEPPAMKHVPIDHKKELERYEAEIKADIAYDIEERIRINNLNKQQ